MNQRTKQAQQILQMERPISQYEMDKFRVRSQTTPDKFYIVSRTGNGLVCECKDNQYRKSDCKHIKVILEVIKKNRGFATNVFRIMERSKLQLCKYCDSGDIIKRGTRKTKQGSIQRYGCRDCKRQFTTNFGFEKMRYDKVLITRALQLYYRGLSVRDIADSFEQEEIIVSYRAVYDWIAKYSRLVSDYIDGIVPRTSSRLMVRADEVWIKVAGQQKYLFASMDDDTRYWIASDNGTY